MYLLFIIIPILVSAFVLFGIGWFIYRIIKRKKEGGVSHQPIFASTEDLARQWYLTIGAAFVGISLLLITRKAGAPIELQTVILISSIIGIAGAVYGKMILPFVFYSIGIFIWATAQMTIWAFEFNFSLLSIFVVAGLVAITFYTMGLALPLSEAYKRAKTSLTVLGFLIILIMFFVISTGLGMAGIEELSGGGLILSTFQSIAFIFVLAGIAITALLHAYNKRTVSAPEIAGIVTLLVFFLWISFFQELDLVNNTRYSGINAKFTAGGILWATFSNIFLALYLIGMLFLGYKRHQVALINTGAILVFLFIVTKYFDWFFTFIDKSIFFIGAGIIMLVVGWSIERGRKKLLTQMQSSSIVSPEI